MRMFAYYSHNIFRSTNLFYPVSNLRGFHTETISQVKEKKLPNQMNTKIVKPNAHDYAGKTNLELLNNLEKQLKNTDQATAIKLIQNTRINLSDKVQTNEAKDAILKQFQPIFDKLTQHYLHTMNIYDFHVVFRFFIFLNQI